MTDSAGGDRRLGATLRVLVVEDDDSIALLVRRVLTRAGYQAVSVSTAEAALSHLAHASWDGLVADFRLPGATGLELVQRVRAIGMELRIVVMTADRTVGLAEEARRCGADDFLSKPFTPERLRACVARVLARGSASAGSWLGGAPSGGAPEHRVAGCGSPDVAT